MRSRYSAHACGNADYLLQTTLPEQRAQLKRSQLESWMGATRFLRLWVLDTGAGPGSPVEGWVRFEALYCTHGQHFLHAELSRFECRQGVWYFDAQPRVQVDGAGQHGLQETTRLARNDACPCGSGRKFKKCCSHL